MPVCRLCKKDKGQSLFYKQSSNTSGYRTECKECTKAAVMARRHNNIEEYRLRDRGYAQSPIRLKKKLDYQRQHRLKRKSKYQARRKVGVAIANGTLVRQPCEVCSDVKTEAHHDDYDKPLDVRWLGFLHHRMVHGQYQDKLEEEPDARSEEANRLDG